MTAPGEPSVRLGSVRLGLESYICISSAEKLPGELLRGAVACWLETDGRTSAVSCSACRETETGTLGRMKQNSVG